MNKQRPTTLGAFKEAGFIYETVKDELRRNLIERIRAGQTLFPGIVGYEQTVIPSIENAVLSKHNLILLQTTNCLKSFGAFAYNSSVDLRQ